MKWCRFQIGSHVSHGIVEDDRVIEVTGSPFEEHTITKATHRLDSAYTGRHRKSDATLTPSKLTSSMPNPYPPKFAMDVTKPAS